MSFEKVIGHSSFHLLVELIEETKLNFHIIFSGTNYMFDHTLGDGSNSSMSLRQYQRNLAALMALTQPASKKSKCNGFMFTKYGLNTTRYDNTVHQIDKC